MFLHLLFFAPRQPIQARTVRFTQAVQTIAAMFPSLQTWKSPTNCCFAWCRCDSLSLRLSGCPSHESTCRDPFRSRSTELHKNLCPPPLLPLRLVWQLAPVPFFVFFPGLSFPGRVRLSIVLTARARADASISAFGFRFRLRLQAKSTVAAGSVVSTQGTASCGFGCSMAAHCSV